MAAGRHLGFYLTGSSAVRSAVPENPTPEPNTKYIGSPIAEICPFEFFKMAAGRHLWFELNRQKRRSIRRPRKLHHRIKHKVDRTTHCRDMAIWNFSKWPQSAILDMLRYIVTFTCDFLTPNGCREFLVTFSNKSPLFVNQCRFQTVFCRFLVHSSAARRRWGSYYNGTDQSSCRRYLSNFMKIGRPKVGEPACVRTHRQTDTHTNTQTDIHAVR